VVKVIGRIAVSYGRFSRIRQVALMCTASNTRFLGPIRVHSPWQTASRSVQPFLHSLRQSVIRHALNRHLIHDSLDPSVSSTQTALRSVQPFLHSLRQSDLMLKNGPPSLVKIAPFHGGSGPHLTHDSLAHPSRQPKRHLDRLCCFCTYHPRVSLYFTMGRHSPLFPNYGSLKIARENLSVYWELTCPSAT